MGELFCRSGRGFGRPDGSGLGSAPPLRLGEGLGVRSSARGVAGFNPSPQTPLRGGEGAEPRAEEEAPSRRASQSLDPTYEANSSPATRSSASSVGSATSTASVTCPKFLPVEAAYAGS